MTNSLRFFLFKKNLVFQIFIKKRIDNFKETVRNTIKFNAHHTMKELAIFFLFAKKKFFLKDNELKKISQLWLHSALMSSYFLINNELHFFLFVFFYQKTKKLIFLEKLYENNLYSFSKVFKGTVFGVWENKKYSVKFLNDFLRLWRLRHRSRVKENTRLSFLDYSKRVYSYKLYVYYSSKLIDIKHKLLITVIPSSIIRYFITVFKIPQNETMFKNTTLLISPKYSSSSLHKYININTFKYEYQFLRKNKVYNKGRYSRTRQNYRTGVYMCVYLSLVTIFGLYFIFYRFSFSFTHLWWLYVYFIFSFFAPKIIQNRLYEPSTLIKKSINFIRWIISIIKSFK